jgi:hypothetical protein
MKAFSALLILLAISRTAATAFSRPERLPSSSYTDGVHGFSIRPPEFPIDPQGINVTPVMFFAAPENGFSSNVNVGVQKVSMTADAYYDLSIKQFKTAGLTVNSDSRTKVSGKDAIRLDYEGTLQGRELRWLALAVVEKERVILVTATSPKASFEKYEKQFRACLDSFKLSE